MDCSMPARDTGREGGACSPNLGTSSVRFLESLLHQDPVVIAGILMATAVAALLLAEWRNSRAGIWLTKPVASTIFVVAAIAAGAPGSAFGRLILLGLALSWLGDVLLIAKQQRFFIAGLVSFLLAHVAYSAAFLLQPLAVQPLIVASILMAVFAVVFLSGGLGLFGSLME